MAIPGNDDDPTRGEGPVVVTRTVYTAAQAFEKTLGPGTPGAIGEAQDRMDKAHATGNAAEAAHWSAIYRYLMGIAGAGKGTRAVILEDGETYDFENDKVIRPRARRPRSDKDA